MQQDALISVIVPIYNVESYLEECISSIVCQSYRNLEIILVDDGSTDRSGEICDAWQMRDQRIIVIHKPNGGLSDARNVGMARASGTLIGFVDSDDFIAPDMYAALAERLIADGSDIAACFAQRVLADGTPCESPAPIAPCILDTSRAIQELLKGRLLSEPVYCRLYRCETIQGIDFPYGKYFEDVFWSYQVIARARQVSVVDSALYFYRKRPGSITMSGYSLNSLHALEGQLQRLDFVQNHFPEAELMAQRHLLYTSLGHIYLSVCTLKGKARRQALRFLIGALRHCLLPRGSVCRKRFVYWACALWGVLPLKVLRFFARRLARIFKRNKQ